MHRVRQLVLIISTLVASWLGMQAVHEAGHIMGAWLTGGRVAWVVLHPLTISRTDLADNPKPLIVVWAGPIVGGLLPLLLWVLASKLRLRATFVLRFFAGFCLLANGLYIGIGSFDGIGDCGEMLRHGSPRWLLWFFGALTAPIGLWLWHGQGSHFGLGSVGGEIDPRIAYGTLGVSVALLTVAAVFGGA